MPRKKTATINTNGTALLDIDEAPESVSVMTVKPPNFAYVSCKIIGNTIYCQNKFGARALQQMRAQQLAGGAAKSKKVHDPKNFEQLYEDAKHVSTEGWCGIPSSSFRNAMIDACRTCGGVMTRARLAIFAMADGYDDSTGEALTRITKGDPYKLELPVRNSNGVVDIRARPAWSPGWEAMVTIRFDRDMISIDDVVNLLVRVGLQVGIGEGRPSSKKSNGIGWGLFDVEMVADGD